MKILSLLIIFSYLLGSCANKQNAKAKIFERKEVEADKLMIKYAFVVKGQSYIDSAVIENKKLNSDSIFVNFNPENPLENSPVVPE